MPSTESELSTLVAETDSPTLNPDPEGSSGGHSGSIRYFGDYEIIAEVARGGMGVVFKARQTTLNRIVAVKMILAGELASDVAVRRFYKEAEAAATLQHPNIVAIHEVGEHAGCHYFSMDLVEGEDLSRRLVRGPLDPLEAAACLRKVAAAIAYAHRHGTLHRDLKPSNILIDLEGEPRVTDFGLAKRQTGGESLTLSGAILGTPAYMAPEQAEGRAEEIDRRTDVFALGGVLYAMLTGRAPFGGETPLAIMRSVVEADPPLPSSLNRAVPRDLERVCLKCLEKNPVNRYQTATELAEDLDRFLSNEPVKASSRSRAFVWMDWIRKNQWLPTGILSIGLMTMVVLLYTSIQHSEYLRWKSSHPGEMTERTPFMGFIGFRDPSDPTATILLFAALLFLPPGLLTAFGFLKIRGRLSSGLLNGFLFSALFNMGLCMAAIFRGAYCVVWNEEDPKQVLVFSLVLVPSAGFGMYLLWLVAREWRARRFGEKQDEVRATFGEFKEKPKSPRKPVRRSVMNLMLMASLILSVIEYQTSLMNALFMGIQASWGAFAYVLIRRPSRLKQIFQVPRLNRLVIGFVLIIPAGYFVMIPIAFPALMKEAAWPAPFASFLATSLIGACFMRLYEALPATEPSKTPTDLAPSFAFDEKPYVGFVLYVAGLIALQTASGAPPFNAFFAFTFSVATPAWCLSFWNRDVRNHSGHLVTAILMVLIVLFTNAWIPGRSTLNIMAFGLVVGVIYSAVPLFIHYRRWKHRRPLAIVWSILALSGLAASITCWSGILDILKRKPILAATVQGELAMMADPFSIFVGTAELEQLRRSYSEYHQQAYGLKFFERLRRRIVHQPHLDFHLRWVTARLAGEMGKSAEAASDLSELSRSFKLIGATNFMVGPSLREAEVQGATTPTPQNPSGNLPGPWKAIRIPEGQLPGYVDLASHFDGKTSNTDGQSCFVRLLVTSPLEGRVRLGFGCNGGINAWWNGAMLSRKMFHQTVTLDHDVAIVDLQRGTNVFVARIRKSGKDWGMFLRMTASNKTGIPGLEFAFRQD